MTQLFSKRDGTDAFHRIFYLSRPRASDVAYQDQGRITRYGRRVACKRLLGRKYVVVVFEEAGGRLSLQRSR